MPLLFICALDTMKNGQPTKSQPANQAEKVTFDPQRKRFPKVVVPCSVRKKHSHPNHSTFLTHKIYSITRLGGYQKL